MRGGWLWHRRVVVSFSQVLEAGVIETHSRKYLRHVAEVYLHDALLESCAVSCQRANSKPVGKHLEVRYGNGDTGKYRSKGDPLVELQTRPPGGVSGTLFACADTVELRPYCGLDIQPK